MMRTRRLGLLAIVFIAVAAFAADVPKVQLNSASAGPKEMQQQTQQSVARAYERAWEVLARALEENRADLLDGGFVGAARDAFAEAIHDQSLNGLRRRYVDRGHKVDVLFYSPEGMSVQLRDRAQLEMQVLDGDAVIHREQVSITYIALLTPTEVTWKVRVLQAAPE